MEDSHNRTGPNMRSRRFPSAAIIGILLLGAALRIPRLLHSNISYDELYTIWASRLPLDELMQEVPASAHPPLYYLLGHIWFYPGAGDAWVRMISWTAGVMAIMFAYLLGKELFSRRAGLWAAALTACSPLLVVYSSKVTDYSFHGMAVVASMYLLARSINRGGGYNWAAYVVAATAVLFSHNLGLVVLAAEVLFFFLYRERGSGNIRAWLIGQGVLAVALVFWLYLILSRPGFTTEPGTPAVVAVIREILSAPVIMVLAQPNISGTGLPWTILPLLVLLIMAFAVSGYRSELTNRKVLALAGTLGAIIAGTLLVLVSYSDDINREMINVRYYVAAAPLLFVLLAQLIAVMRLKAGTVAGLIMVAGMLLLTGQHLQSEGWDYEAYMQTASRNAQPGDMLLCFPVNHCYVSTDYYGIENLPITGGYVGVEEDKGAYFDPSIAGTWEGYRDVLAPGSDLLTGHEIETKLDDITAGATRLWLFIGSEQGKDIAGRDGVFSALEKRWEVVETWELSGPFTLVLYEPKRSG